MAQTPLATRGLQSMSQYDDFHSTKVGRKKKSQMPKRPNTTFKRFIEIAMPHFCSSFLFSGYNKFIFSKFLLAFGFGGLMGFAIYLFLIDPLKLPTVVKTVMLYILTVTFASGWGFSVYFRCTTLIVILNILGKEGRAYLFIFVLSAIYAGPGATLQHNFSEIPRSIACTADLQINNTKILWKILSTPVKSILGNFVQRTKDFRSIGDDVRSSFKETKNQVESTSGYNIEKEKQLRKKKKATSTQQKFDIKTMLRCEYIIELGIVKCHEWFERKHEDCMSTIGIPIINHILCIPMKFSFLCNILNMGEAWCKKHNPLESNFGEMYDQAVMAVKNIGSGFSSKLQVIKNEEADAGLNITEMSLKDKIISIIENRRVIIETMSALLKTIMAGTFLFVFVSSLKYTRCYNSDIEYDNWYVTSYFRQIDARRRKHKKRYLLPLKKGETSSFIFPFSPVIHRPEMPAMISELCQCLLPIIMLILVVMFDNLLFHILDIVRRHANISYAFASYHKLQVIIGGNTMLASILRKTVNILNSTSNTFEASNNQICLPKLIKMSYIDYIVTCAPVFGLICLSIFQVYFYRLRRVVASYYFPKREKRRVLFLYNDQLRKRAIYIIIKSKQIGNEAQVRRRKMKTPLGTLYRHCKWLRYFYWRRCIVCNECESQESFVCPTPGCGVIYCKQCWRDMKRFCFACSPYEGFILDLDFSNSEHGSD